VQLRREQAAANPAFLPDLAGALNNLGIRYSEVGRRQHAVPPTQDAAATDHPPAAAFPPFLPDLASALNNLGNRYSEVGRPERAEAFWQDVTAQAEPAAAAFLLIARAAAADAGRPAAAAWIAAALRLAGDDRGLIGAGHDQARRHREADSNGFDAAWRQQTGEQPPAWLAVDVDLLATARGWIDTGTYEAERDHLA